MNTRSYIVTLRQKDGKEEDVQVDAYSAEDAVFQAQTNLFAAVTGQAVIAVNPTPPEPSPSCDAYMQDAYGPHSL